LEPETVRHTYRIINKPLTWFGCDKWFVLSGFMLAANFYGVFGAFWPGVFVLALFITLGRFKASDPVKLPLLISSGQYSKAMYDPGKREPFVVIFK
jgi:hypothetical protein